MGKRKSRGANTESDPGAGGVSVLSWMLLQFLTALPCIGVLAIVVLAFVGKDQTRKNYFRALIAWFLIGMIVLGALAIAGFWPQLQKQITACIEWLLSKLGTP